MGARQSAEMTRALDLIMLAGKSAAEAARLAGVTKGAISKNKTYRQWKGQQDEKQAAKPD